MLHLGMLLYSCYYNVYDADYYLCMTCFTAAGLKNCS